MNLLLDPHGDDAVLFSCFNLLRYRPHVVCVLRSQVQADRGTGITYQEREKESAEAFAMLGVSYEQWPYLDREPDWPAIEADLRILDGRHSPEIVLAPMSELDGHEHHSTLWDVAYQVFGGERLLSYMTYRRGNGRSEGTPVDPEPGWIALKHRALACFTSQIREPTTRPWFLDRLDEYVA